MTAPRKQSLLAPHESQQVALFPTQPASPPPDHLLRAGLYTSTSLVRLPTPIADQDCPTRAYNILRWVGYALLHGFHALGIDVVDGWAHLHQLAKAAVSDRKDLEGLTPGALRRVIEQDTTGRWMIVGDRVCKVPRHARRAVLPATPMDEYQDIRPRLCDVPAAVSPPATQTLEMGVVACHCALSECVYHYSLLEKSLCQPSRRSNWLQTGLIARIELRCFWWGVFPEGRKVILRHPACHSTLARMGRMAASRSLPSDCVYHCVGKSFVLFSV